MANPEAELQRFYAQRETIGAAGRVAEAAVASGDRSAVREAERLFAELKRIDQAIDRLEAGNDAKH